MPQQPLHHSTLEKKMDLSTGLQQITRQPPKILIADDVEVNRLILKKYVVNMGYTPLLVENGRDALVHIEQQQPDLLLLDILMPVMDGYQVLSRLKADEATRDLPVLIISSVESLDSVIRCIERGADDYLVKPFNPTVLKARVNACLDKKMYRDRERRLHEELAVSYAALRTAEKARDALTNMIVHDLKNPLSVVMGGTDLVLEYVMNPLVKQDKATDMLNFVRDGAKEMSSLINSILDVAKLESGKMAISMVPVNAVETARHVYENMVIQAGHLNIQCTFHAETDDLIILADPELLSRILQNLLSNAFKHLGSGNQVELSVKKIADEVVFVVSDDGIGISKEHQKTIFDKYVQVDAHGSAGYGVGLGLAFCNMAVTAHHGRIWVESAPEEGARFYIALKAKPHPS